MTRAMRRDQSTDGSRRSGLSDRSDSPNVSNDSSVWLLANEKAEANSSDSSPSSFSSQDINPKTKSRTWGGSQTWATSKNEKQSRNPRYCFYIWLGTGQVLFFMLSLSLCMHGILNLRRSGCNKQGEGDGVGGGGVGGEPTGAISWYDRHVSNERIWLRFEEDNSAVYRTPGPAADQAWDRLFKYPHFLLNTSTFNELDDHPSNAYTYPPPSSSGSSSGSSSSPSSSSGPSSSKLSGLSGPSGPSDSSPSSPSPSGPFGPSGSGPFVRYQASLAVFHHLHCVKLLWQFSHRSYYQTREPWFFTDSEHLLHTHLDHCADVVRQALMCNPDLSVETFHDSGDPELPERNHGIRRSCRRFDGVLEWVGRQEKIGS